MANEVTQSVGAMKDQTKSGRESRGLGHIFSGRMLSMLIVFALLCLFFHFASDGIFFHSRNLSLLLRQASIVAVVAAGVSILMVMGEIDLSIGSSVFLCSVLAATLQFTYNLDPLLTIVVTVLAGIVMGGVQGLLVVTLGVPSFIVTLAGLLAFRGIGYYATDAATIGPVSDAFSAVSEGFVPVWATYVILVVAFVVIAAYLVRRERRQATHGEAFDRTKLTAWLIALAAAFGLLAWIFGGFLGMPNTLVWMTICGAVLWVVMTKSKFGRNAYLIGSNREAAALAGIRIVRQILGGFLIMGALYGIAGVLITARLGSATPSTGTYMELDAIAGAVIGGTSLRGGVGTVIGAIVGSVLLAMIDNGMSIMNVSSFIQLIVKGVVLVLALSIDAYMLKHRRFRA